MEIQTTLNQVQTRMKNSQYALTSIVDQQFIVNDNIVLGMQLTKGLWYKLRIWSAFAPNQENPTIIEQSEQFLYLINAQLRMKEIRKAHTC